MSQARCLINKYAGHHRVIVSNRLFPNLSNQKINSNLKEIANLCGIKKNLTFYMARHTFATTITLSNGVPIETVSKLLGHTKIVTTQIYARVLEKKTGEDMWLLEQKLNKEVKASQKTTVNIQSGTYRRSAFKSHRRRKRARLSNLLHHRWFRTK